MTILTRSVIKAFTLPAFFLLATSCDVFNTDDSDDNGDPNADELYDGYRGYSWDQTHVNTQWLFDANENNNLTIEKVTTLNDRGAGSLSAALSAAERNENTLIVFEVGGIIDNGGTTFIRSHANNVYIAGQTAPWPGITVIRGGLRVHGNQTIVQHLTLLPGDEVDSPNQSRAATLDADTRNVLFDHVTAGWATDTNVSFRQHATRQAFINGINAEALNVSSHHESPHGYGTHHRTDNTLATVMGVLNMHNWKRNPVSKYRSSSMNWISVYSFNWGARHYHGSSNRGADMSWIGNVSYDGEDTASGYPIFKDGTRPRVYYNNNLILNGNHPIGDNVDLVDEPLNLPEGFNEEDIVPADELEQFIIDVAGARPADRAPEDQRMIDDFINRQGRIINSFADHPDYPVYESTTRELEPPDTNILSWLQHYSDEVEIGKPNPLH